VAGTNYKRSMTTNESINREYPERPIASVAVCVFKGDRILVIKRATPPSQGLWSVPGGMVELGEAIQDTAKREIQEECGIEIDVGEVFHVANLVVPDEKGLVRFHYVITYILADYASGNESPGSDALDVKWVTSEELDNLDMSPVVRENMLKAFKIKNSSG
jgi:8-oxo-dGTP diphosphatase